MHLRASLLALVVAVLLAGCGGSEEGNAAAEPTATPKRETAPTKAEYVAQLNRLCSGKGERAAKAKSRALDRAVAKAGKDLNAALASGAPTAAILDRVGRLHIRIAETREDASARMRKLTPPREGAPEGFLEAFDAIAVAVRTFGEDAPKMDGPRRTWIKDFEADVAAINRAGAAFATQARALGAKRCIT